VPGEVLAAGQDSAVLEAACECDAASHDDARVGAEGSVADDRVVRACVHVEHGCKIHRESKSGELRSEGARGAADEVDVARAAERAHRGEREDGSSETRHSAPFLVDRDERRQLSPRVSKAGVEPKDGAEVIREVSLEEHRSATFPSMKSVRIRRWQLRAIESPDENLAADLCERQLDLHGEAGLP
jgi:hypothetical protein